MSNHQTIAVPPLADAFKALGHPHRLQIFHRLSSCCAPGTACTVDEAVPRCVGELAAELDIAPSTVSHHLKELTRAGLIATERCGREIRCWVEPDVLRDLGDFFHGFVTPPARPTPRRTSK
ncbi:MAG: transcriptional regulator [Gemmatimonadales bacterium]|jgi:DNA-binding transcriptional ArsR family regulator|nr:MAG: transcriptional regulator [Gemmatimonadales bacterium]